MDAAVAASAVVMNLQTVVSREMDPLEPGCVTVGRIQSGSRFNCVADSAQIEGTTRAFSQQASNAFAPVLQRIAQETAKAFRASATVKYDELAGPVVNDPEMAVLVQDSSRKIISKNAPVNLRPLCGGEDFGFFMRKKPGVLALLGVKNEACGAVWPQHSGKYCVDEEVLLQGAMLYAQVAMDFTKMEQ